MNVLPKSQWVPDYATKKCMIRPCSSVFTFSNRRHHCRMCGHVICQKCSSQRHPKTLDLRICTTCYRSFMVSSNKLQDCGWYHGHVSRAVAERRLLSPNTRPGDYVVRDSFTVDGKIALSVKRMKNSQIDHYLIKELEGCFFIGDATPQNTTLRYTSIADLVASCAQSHGLLRPMVVEPYLADHDSLVCGGCGIICERTAEFCTDCGTRVQSTVAQRQIYAEAPELPASFWAEMGVPPTAPVAGMPVVHTHLETPPPYSAPWEGLTKMAEAGYPEKGRAAEPQF